MHADGLRTAYAGFLDAATTVARRTDTLTPADGGWDADRILAHVALVDAATLATVAAVASGGAPTFDNRLSLDGWTAARVHLRAGGGAGLRERIRSQGEALCVLAEMLDDAELDVPVPTLLRSGDEVLVEQPLPLRALLAGLADDHLPRHAEQLLALLPEPDSALAPA
jgi:hypothetical protein